VVAARSERPTNRYGVSVHAAWRTEAVRGPGPSAGRASLALADWGGRNPGILRRTAPAPRTVQPARSLPAVWANGGSLLHGARAARILALIEQRGSGRAI
jgi:hypothetical protein